MVTMAMAQTLFFNRSSGNNTLYTVYNLHEHWTLNTYNITIYPLCIHTVCAMLFLFSSASIFALFTVYTSNEKRRRQNNNKKKINKKHTQKPTPNHQRGTTVHTIKTICREIKIYSYHHSYVLYSFIFYFYFYLMQRQRQRRRWQQHQINDDDDMSKKKKQKIYSLNEAQYLSISILANENRSRKNFHFNMWWWGWNIFPSSDNDINIKLFVDVIRRQQLGGVKLFVLFLFLFDGASDVACDHIQIEYKTEKHMA